MTTLAALAAEFAIQEHEVLAGLDITEDANGTDEIEAHGWTEAEAREVLTVLAEQAADRA